MLWKELSEPSVYIGKSLHPFSHNWKSINCEEILAMTEEFSGKKKIHEMEATVSKKTVRKKHYSTKRRIQDNFQWSGFI